MDAKTTGSPLSDPAKEPAALRSLLGRTNRDWWPNQLSLEILRQQGATGDPYGDDFDYAEAFKALDYEALKRDLTALMTDSQPWWPADYGHYGPFFIRMAWHAAGTYRTGDGRGGANSGQQRFAPLNSWPDNANLDKARRLLWPIKQKYGRNLSWADLLVLAGNVAIESMGGPTFGFGGGRKDVYEPEHDVYWGTEENWVGKGAKTRIVEGTAFEDPLAAVQMGLIYVNPEGPGRQSRSAAVGARHPHDLRPHGDERRGDGRAHRRRPHLRQVPRRRRRLEGRRRARGRGHRPAGPRLAERPPERHGRRHDHQRPRRRRGRRRPDQWNTDNGYFHMLLDYEYELVTSPAGAKQWQPVNQKPEDMAPGAHSPDRRVPTMMTTADMAFKMDPEYRKISERFRANPDQFADAFARAWFKLTHRDMGPKARYLGPEVPAEDLIWQDPIPAGTRPSDGEVADLKAEILASGLTRQRAGQGGLGLGRRPIASSDHRGGANGARIRLAPQKDWEVNDPAELAKVLAKLDELRGNVSLADADRARRLAPRSRRRPGMPATTSPCRSPAAAATPARRRPTPRASSRSSPRPTASATICRSATACRPRSC